MASWGLGTRFVTPNPVFIRIVSLVGVKLCTHISLSPMGGLSEPLLQPRTSSLCVSPLGRPPPQMGGPSSNPMKHGVFPELF